MEKQKSVLTYDVLSKYRGILMGLATLSVLVFHFVEDARLNNYHYEGIVKFLNRYVSSSGVDIFLLLSGLGLYYAWKKNSNFKSFISKRFKRILIPYVLVAVPAYTIREIILLDKGFIGALKGFTFYNMIKVGDTWHWYILMSVICYLIFPWIYEIVEENKSRIQSHIILLGAFTVTTIVALLIQQNYPALFKNINIMLLRFPAFVFGVFLGRASYEKRVMGKDWIAFGILCFICLPLRSTDKIMLVRYVVGALNMFVAFIMVRVFAWLDDHNAPIGFVNKVLQWFGKYSLEIYLLHVTVRSIMNRLGYYTYQFKYFLVEIAITIILSLILKKLTDMLIKLLTPKKKEVVSVQQ